MIEVLMGVVYLDLVYCAMDVGDRVNGNEMDHPPDLGDYFDLEVEKQT
jgi:hypothetical protein